MSIKVTCRQCQKILKAPDKLAGKRVRCPSCQEIVQVPQADAVEAADDLLSEPPSQSTPDPEHARSNERDAGDKRGRPSSKSEQEFDWSQPLEPSDETQKPDEFDNFDKLPEAPAVPRRKPRKSADEDVAFAAPVGSEESNKPVSRNSKSRAKRPRELTQAGAAGHWHWLLALAMIPLAISIAMPTPPVMERLQSVFDEHPELFDKLEQLQSREQFFEFVASLPDGRVPGAHLARNTVVHWSYALVAAAIFLALIIAMFPGSKARPGQLLMFGLLTGTVGIVLLISFQWVAEFTQNVQLRRVRGIIGLLFYIVKFIGFSYRCATDGETGFVLSFVGFTCGVGLCEELCKALPLAFYLGASRDANWRSACLVGLASGIGFGISEGIMYSSDYYNGIAPGLTYLVRFASCVTLHAVWASSVAMLMYNNQDYLPGQNNDFGWDTVLSFVACYLGIAMVLHGLYDTLLKQELEVAALAVAAASFGWWSWLLYRQTAAE